MPNGPPRSLHRVCIFCGSHDGNRPLYRTSAEAVGHILAKAGVEIVYGGGKVGLMGALADGALAAGGTIIGVIPQRLVELEVVHRGLTHLHVVQSMHERKMLMAELVDAFIALPGGYGTLEEFCEVVTWTQLGIHHKPCGLLNVNGFFDPMLAQIDWAVTEGFISAENRALVLADENIERLVDALRRVRLPAAPKQVNQPAP